MRAALVALAALALAACARPPRPLGGTFPATTVAEAQAADHRSERVRWGGKLVTATPEPDQTCFEVVSQPLDREARPQRSDTTFGRFAACAPGFYDPAIYEPGREVTVVGRVTGTTERKVGDREYRFPLVEAEAVHLWPERAPGYYGPWYPSPWYGPWFGGWGGVYWLRPAPRCH